MGRKFWSLDSNYSRINAYDFFFIGRDGRDAGLMGNAIFALFYLILMENKRGKIEGMYWISSMSIKYISWQKTDRNKLWKAIVSILKF